MRGSMESEAAKPTTAAGMLVKTRQNGHLGAAVASPYATEETCNNPPDLSAVEDQNGKRSPGMNAQGYSHARLYGHQGLGNDEMART